MPRSLNKELYSSVLCLVAYVSSGFLYLSLGHVPAVGREESTESKSRTNRAGSREQRTRAVEQMRTELEGERIKSMDAEGSREKEREG